MNAKEKLHQLRLNKWAAKFSEQKASGLTVRHWCDQNNYSIHTYIYWKHLLKEEIASQALTDIVPISIPDPAVQGTYCYRQAVVEKYRRDFQAEIKVRFAPPTMCHLTSYYDLTNKTLHFLNILLRTQ